MLMNSKKGFTLIELMVVVAVVAILAMVILVSLRSAREAAEDTNRMTAVAQLRSFAYVDFKEDDIDFNDLSTFTGGIGDVICEYGDPEDANSSRCLSKGVFNMYANLEEKEFCATIQLEEKDSEGNNRYFCIDTNLSGRKYNVEDHTCSQETPVCSDDD